MQVEQADQVLLSFPSFNAPTQLFTSSGLWRRPISPWLSLFLWPFPDTSRHLQYLVPSNRTPKRILVGPTHVPKWWVFNIKKVLNGSKNKKWYINEWPKSLRIVETYPLQLSLKPSNALLFSTCQGGPPHQLSSLAALGTLWVLWRMDG